MEVIELKKLCKKQKIKFEEQRKIYPNEKGTPHITRKCCDVLINVSFKESYIEYIDLPDNEKYKRFNGEKIKSVNVKKNISIEPEFLRTELYNNGFICDGIKYVEYKRSASKARTGNTLFIREDLYKHMITWSHLDIEFAENEIVDVTSLRAYESLSMSGIENTVSINTRNILLIDDAISTFKATISSTEYGNNKNIITRTKEDTITNIIWDGQSLLDKSVFEGAGYGQQGMLLLRNRFFKSCAFNTNLQQWFADKNIENVYDMFGKKHNASEILMITTPSSLKLLKFAYKIGTQYECYKYWVKKAGNLFGIVKTEHESKFASSEVNQMAYQYINSLPLNYEEVEQLYNQYDKPYIQAIRTDTEAFKNHIGIKDELNIHSQLYHDLIKRDVNILQTEEIKQYRRDCIANYKRNIKKGKIKLYNTDYCTVVGNPFEMLQACVLPTNKQKDINQMEHPLIGWQISCTAYENGMELAGFRSPHICSGNTVYCTNVISGKITKYFNFSKNIAVLNSIDTDILNRGQGSDFDADAYEFTSNPIIVKAVRKCQVFPTPVNNITASKLNLAYNNTEKSEIDNKLSDNKIGEIVNLSQVLNSYYWQYKHDGATEAKLDAIYNDISLLSTLSQIELDRAKKGYTFKTSKYLKAVRKRSYIKKAEKLKQFTKIDKETEASIINATKCWLLNSHKCKTCAEADKLSLESKWQEAFFKYALTEDTEILKKVYHAEEFCVFSNVQIRPAFFKSIVKEGQNVSDNYIYKEMHCPMDMLQRIVKNDKKQRNKNNTKSIPMIYFLIDNPIGSANKRQHKAIMQAVDNICRMQTNEKRRLLLADYTESFAKTKINQATMHHLLSLIYGKKTNSKFDYAGNHKKYSLQLLYRMQPEIMVSCYKKAE